MTRTGLILIPILTLTKAQHVNILRCLSKLCRVFISYIASSGDSEVGIFRHPTGSFEIQMRVGSRMVPENAIKDDPTSWYQLTKALSIQADSSRDINITKALRHFSCLSRKVTNHAYQFTLVAVPLRWHQPFGTNGSGTLWCLSLKRRVRK